MPPVKVVVHQNFRCPYHDRVFAGVSQHDCPDKNEHPQEAHDTEAAENEKNGVVVSDDHDPEIDTAHLSAGDILTDAKAQAEKILKDANEQADKIKAEAKA